MFRAVVGAAVTVPTVKAVQQSTTSRVINSHEAGDRRVWALLIR